MGRFVAIIIALVALAVFGFEQKVTWADFYGCNSQQGSFANSACLVESCSPIPPCYGPTVTGSCMGDNKCQSHISYHYLECDRNAYLCQKCSATCFKVEVCSGEYCEGSGWVANGWASCVGCNDWTWELRVENGPWPMACAPHVQIWTIKVECEEVAYPGCM